MQIQINTDHNIEGHEGLATDVRSVIEGALGRFTAHITRLEVHLSNQSGTKGSDETRCMIEARLEGRLPTAVTHEAATVDQAVQGAAEKLHRSIDSTLGRLRDDHH